MTQGFTSTPSGEEPPTPRKFLPFIVLLFFVVLIPTSSTSAQQIAAFGCNINGCNTSEVGLGWVTEGPQGDDYLVELYEFIGATYVSIGTRIGSPMNDCFPLNDPSSDQFRLHVYTDMTGTVVADTAYCSLSPTTSNALECNLSVTPIPDLGGGPAVVSISSVSSLTLSDLDVAVQIQHPAVGDLLISVSSPMGTMVTIHSNLGGNSSDIFLMYDDGGIANASPYDAGGAAMQPSGPGTMADFIGECTSGSWTLDISDTVAGNTGTLLSWCLSSSGSSSCIHDDFWRSDSNADGSADVADLVYILNYLFSSGPALPCADSGDLNDDGFIDIADAIFGLAWLFGFGANPPAPTPGDCGADPTPDGLDCASSPFCP